MASPRSKSGLVTHSDGSVETVRFYYGDDEPDPPSRTRLDPEQYATWTDDDGAVGIRRGTSMSVGASPIYSANYDAIDWGN